MEKIELTDLEFLYLGMKNNGVFSEKDIDNSELKKLGTGRILDKLASLRERKLIDVNSNGSFSLTKDAKQILWIAELPPWVKILRLLQIHALPIEKISQYLGVKEEQLIEDIERMRKSGLLMMSPLRTAEKLEKMYEILPEGIEELEKIETMGFENANLIMQKTVNRTETIEILDQILKLILNDKKIDDQKKKLISSKISQIKDKLMD